MSSGRNNPLVAALFGILMIPGSMALQAWNEYRTIHRTRGLNEAEEIVEPIGDVNSVRTELDGKLVHLAGEAVTDQMLRDPMFGVEANAIAMHRVVEMYQWDEDKKTDDGKTTYRYNKVWKSGRINSDRFKKSASHQNPEPAFDSWDRIADDVMVGRYEISDALKRQKQDQQPAPFDIEAVRQSVGDPQAAHLVKSGSQLFYGATAPKVKKRGRKKRAAAESANDPEVSAGDFPDEQPFAAASVDPSSPQIGDLRIRFEMVPNGPVSLMAGLKGNTFSSYQTSNGEPIERLYPEILTAAQVVENMRSENSVMAWILRGVGFVVCLVGMLMIFAPAQALFRWIPLVGDIAGGLMFAVSLGVAAILSLLTISVSWIAVRPLLSLGLLVIACGIIYLLYRKKKSNDISHGTPTNPDEPMMLTDDMMVS